MIRLRSCAATRSKCTRWRRTSGFRDNFSLVAHRVSATSLNSGVNPPAVQSSRLSSRSRKRPKMKTRRRHTSTQSSTTSPKNSWKACTTRARTSSFPVAIKELWASSAVWTPRNVRSTSGCDSWAIRVSIHWYRSTSSSSGFERKRRSRMDYGLRMLLSSLVIGRQTTNRWRAVAKTASKLVRRSIPILLRTKVCGLDLLLR